MATVEKVSDALVSNSTTTVQKMYDRVIISLENCLLPPEKISPTPSMLDGLDLDTETDLRILGCEFIQDAGILLRLPQVAMATGQVLFQRFFYSKSFIKQSMETVAMACVCLASKIEESPRRIRDVCNVFNHMKQLHIGKPATPMVLDQDYINLKNQVIKAERRVLKELGFCVHVKHPHKTIVTMLQLLDLSENSVLMQRSWNYMNDSLRTNVFVRFTPETIACACIYLSARELRVPLPNNPAWYLLFNATEEEVQDICRSIIQLYERPKANLEKLDTIVADLKALQVEAKLKLRNFSANNTPQTQGFSPDSRTTSPKPTNGTLEKKDVKPSSEDKTNGVSPLEKELNNHSVSKTEKQKSSSRESSKEKELKRSRSISPVKNAKRHIRSPPRSYKEHRHRHRTSRSHSRDIKDKPKIDKKRTRRSRSRSISPYYKKMKDHRRRKSRSRSYSPSPLKQEKSHRTSRKERSRDRRRSHSRERSRR